MSRRNNLVNGDTVSFDDLMDQGRISYVRKRTRAGKDEYGVILDDATLSAHSEGHDSLAESLAYAPYYDAPKLVADFLYAEGISRISFDISAGEFTIERVGL